MLKSVNVISFALMSLSLIAVMVYFINGDSNTNTNAAFNSAVSRKTTVFWLQTMDSCKQAIPGASFRLRGNGLSIDKGPTSGSQLRTIHSKSTCPDQRGDCAVSVHQTGCVSWDVPVPTSGSMTYQIIELAAPKGYVLCIMFPVCKNGPVTVSLTIDSRGVISATVHDTNQNGKPVIWPKTGMPYTGSATDPAVVHDSSYKKEQRPTPTESPTPTPTPTGPPGLPPTGSNPNN
jgi:hypothetical protein